MRHSTIKFYYCKQRSLQKNNKKVTKHKIFRFTTHLEDCLVIDLYIISHIALGVIKYKQYIVYNHTIFDF